MIIENGTVSRRHALEGRKIKIFKSEHLFDRFLVDQFVFNYKHALLTKKIFCVALSGGKTPLSFYEQLSKKKLNWDSVYFFLVDERHVSLNNQDSNYLQIKKNFFDKIDINPENIFYFDTGNEDISHIARSYQDRLVSFFSGQKNIGKFFPVFDVIYLGVGEDGHTASLFPECKVDTENWIVTAVPKKYKYKRISMNYSLINNADKVYFIVKGKNKAEIVKEAFGKENNYPATRIKPSKGELLICLDEPAASLLWKII